MSHYFRLFFFVATILPETAVCLAEPVHQRGAIHVEKTLRGDWQEVKREVIRRGTVAPLIVNAHHGSFQVGKITIPVTTFAMPESGQQWVGPEQDCYVEIEKAVIGFRISGPELRWSQNLSKAAVPQQAIAQTSKDLATAFASNVDGSQLVESFTFTKTKPDEESGRVTSLLGVILERRFFARTPESSQPGNPRIVTAQMDDGLLKLDLTNESGEIKATAWIDLDSRTAVRAVYDQDYTPPLPPLPPKDVETIADQHLPAQAEASPQKKLAVSWQDVKRRVVRAGESLPLVVDAKHAVYRAGRVTIPVTVFAMPGSGHPWVGPEQDCYVETDNAVVGFRVSSSELQWSENLGKTATDAQQAPANTPVDLATAFEKKITGRALLDSLTTPTNSAPSLTTPTNSLPVKATAVTSVVNVTSLLDVIRERRFFAKTPESSQPGKPKIVSSEMDHGLLKLDMTNETGEINATTWIDLKTRKAVRAVCDDYVPAPPEPLALPRSRR
jgi:hypothetical protein